MRTRTWIIRIVAACLLAASLAPLGVPESADAQWFSQRRGLGRAALRACGGDIARLCATVVPGGGRLAQCLTDNRPALSPACRGYVDLGTATRTAFFACNDDAARFCPDVRPGRGRIVACLLQNEALISPGCRGAIAEAESLLGR